MARGGRRNVVFCFPAALRVRVQRFLSPTDDRAVAADPAGNRSRTAYAFGLARLEWLVQWLFRNREFAPHHFLRRRPGQCRARRSAAARRLLLPATLDELEGRLPTG